MFVNAYYKRGSSLLELNQYEEAIADFDVALDLSDYHEPSISVSYTHLTLPTNREV